MTDSEHRELREMLGTFALHQLSSARADQVRDHLRGCAECRTELASLMPVAGELSRLRPDLHAEPSSAPGALGERVVDAVGLERRATRRSQRVRTGWLAAGSAVAAATAAVLVMRALDPAPIPLEPVAVTVDQPGIAAGADLVAHTWGTEIKLTATGLDAGETFRVSILTGGGVEHAAGEFVGTGGREMHCNLNTAVLRPEATGFVVLDHLGNEVLSSTFST